MPSADEEASVLDEVESLLFHDDESVDEDEEGSVQVAKEDIKLMNVVRAIMILVLLTFAFISAEAVFVISTIAAEDNFKDAYTAASIKIIDGFFAKIDADLWAINSLSTELALAAKNAKRQWPFVTYDEFESRCVGTQRITGASQIHFSPIVNSTMRGPWEIFAVASIPSMMGNPPSDIPIDYYSTNRRSIDGIYRFEAGDAKDDDTRDSIVYPVWQLSTPVANETDSTLTTIMFNQGSNSVRLNALQAMEARKGSIISNFHYGDVNSTDMAIYGEAYSTIYYPIWGYNEQVDQVVGSVNVEIRWKEILEGLTEEYRDPLHVVIECSVKNKFTYEVEGGKATFLGQGSLQKSGGIDGYKLMRSEWDTFAVVMDQHGELPLETDSDHLFRITVYPTLDFKAGQERQNPDVYRGIVLAVFFMMVAIFVVYDCLVERRQSRVVDAAQRSDAIVRSLFPSNIRDRLYENAKRRDEENKKALKEDWKNPDHERSSFIESPKNRLKSMMADGNGGENVTGGTGVEPIADLFPNTTVLFADLAGFTAWSSEREPSQVFTLLETIYLSMDKIAKRLGVFKVETVGDCYVGATGIPDAQPDHVEIMVRFAKASLMRVTELTRSLEAQLGPGTADLAMRIGIHSGPVTAGVLRGQKARFQLFGDTMNMGARMETTGLKNKIHISPETANILIQRGKQHLIVPRQDLVHVKGKGDMQTYWLLLGNSSNSVASTDVSEATGEINTLINPQVKKRKSKKERKPWDGTALANVLGQTDLDDNLGRLIDWNVDVLMNLLKRVVAWRIARGQASSSLSSGAEKKIAGEGLVLDEIQMVIAMPAFNAASAIVSEKDVELIPEVKQELKEYVSAIASGYRRNAFHNFEHASHVILSANKLLKRIMHPDQVGPNQKTTITPEELHSHTYGIATDPITQFSVVFSALIHDVGHTGVPNFLLAKEDPALAEKYISKSIAEQHSVDVAWSLLLLPVFKNLRSCIYQNATECKRFRSLVVNSVMATDIFDKELKALRNSRWDMAFHRKEQANGGDEEADRKATIVIEHIIQASDVSHTMQHWYIYQKWNERLFREMYFAYLKDRSDKDPSLGWYEGELWFYDNYVIPLARKLQECGVFGVSSDEYLNYALQNRSEWERKGKNVVESMKERADKEAESLGLQVQLTNIEEEGDEEDLTDDEEEKLTEEEKSEEEPVALNASALAALPPPDVQRAMATERALSAAATQKVQAPPGRLGIVIDTTPKGPVVHQVSPDSPLVGKLLPGDMVIGVDGVDTSKMSIEALNAFLGARADQPRVFYMKTPE